MSEERTRYAIRLVGQWRRLRITVLIAVVLLIVQWPMRAAVLDGDPTWATRWGAGPGSHIAACVVPARLSLLVDALFVYAYTLAAWRARAYVTTRTPRSRGLRRLAMAGAALVSTATVLDLVEDVVLWERFGLSAGTGATLVRGCPDLVVAFVSPLLWVLWPAGVVALGVALVGSVLATRPRRPAPDPATTPDATTPDATTPDATAPGDRSRTESTDDPADSIEPLRAPAVDLAQHDKGGQIICCSGGGIRSAAFSLGALQLLTERGEYQRSSSVIGVSGGGYIAAGYHIVRRTLTGRLGEKPAYAMGTPELAQLRRQTNYLLPSVAVSVRGIMSMLYGAVVNLVLIGIALRGVAWVLGWAIAEAGVIDGLGTANASVDLAEVPLWYWIGALGAFAVVVVLFLAEVVVDRFSVPPRWLRLEGRALAEALTLPGFAMAVLLLGVPLVLVWANNLGQRELTRGSDPSAFGYGLVEAATTVAGADAANTDALLDSQFGFATLVALGSILIALARSAWKGIEGLDRTRHRGDGPTPLRDQLLTWVRTRLAPWLGSALLVAVAVVVLLRWTAGYVASEEWRSRWWVAGLCAVLLVLVSVFTDATRTSLHPYYRERLASAYLVRRTGPDTVEEFDYALPLRFSTWGEACDGGPRLVIVASANAFDREFVPPDRGCVPFVFDPTLTGVAGDVTLPAEGLEPTAAYERRADFLRREVTVPGAIAISGAAFAPLTGRENARTRPMRLLFAVVNARLGVWLPNPYWGSASKAAAFAERCVELTERRRGPGARLLRSAAKLCAHLLSVADKPGMYRLLKEAVGTTSLYDRRLYVTDGGHYDNLGLVEALRRRPSRIIVIDASNDAEDTFTALSSAIATARMDLGVTVEVDPRPLRRQQTPQGSARPDRGWVRGEARYPDGSVAEVLFVKSVLAGELPWDLEAYALRHPDFPRRTTGDQLYGEFDFEAYRALGYTITKDMLDYYAARPDGSATATGVEQSDVVESGVEQSGTEQSHAEQSGVEQAGVTTPAPTTTPAGAGRGALAATAGDTDTPSP